MTPAQLHAYEMAEANTVKGPYLVIAGLFLAVAALIFFSNLPEVREEDEGEIPDAGGGLRGLWPYKHLLKGVLGAVLLCGCTSGRCQFCNPFCTIQHARTAREAGSKFSQATPARDS